MLGSCLRDGVARAGLYDLDINVVGIHLVDQFRLSKAFIKGIVPSEVDVYVTVRAAEALDDFVANLKAPILIRSGRGYQVINQAPGCELRAPLFAEVEVEANGSSSSAC